MSAPNQFPAIRDTVAVDCTVPASPEVLSTPKSIATRLYGSLLRAASRAFVGGRHVIFDLGSKAADPLCAGASLRIEAPAFAEPEIDLWPLRDRIAILIAGLLFGALFWGSLIKVFLL